MRDGERSDTEGRGPDDPAPPLRECDLIMKGGITSGVVYPKAVEKLAEAWRLRAIGGASAGAIAAVMAAAAELRRQEIIAANRAAGRPEGDGAMAGFRLVGRLAEQLQRDMLALFQPAPPFRPYFEAAKIWMKRESARQGRLRRDATARAAEGLPPRIEPAGPAGMALDAAEIMGEKIDRLWDAVLPGAPDPAESAPKPAAAPGAAPMDHEKRWRRRALAALFSSPPGAPPYRVGATAALAAAASVLGASLLPVSVGAILGAAAGAGGYLVWHAIRLMREDLPAHDFGICPGSAQPGGEGPGITEWIADNIDRVAGRDPSGPPLTVGDLRAQGIRLQAMTTDLASRRPYELPLRGGHHCFERGEFERLFPERIVDHLIRRGRPVPDPGVPGEFHELPGDDDFPVLLIARLSLSFPFLISAVPLWRRAGEDASAPLRRCLFSDGGIASNFPIAFYDALIPRRPTFGIFLTSLDPDLPDTQERVLMRRFEEEKGMRLPVAAPKTALSFLASILSTAKDWHDTLQMKLPGYTERVVQIRLDDRSEGGLNLAMDQDTIERLVGYGAQAGEMLADPKRFDFDENRWRRALSLAVQLEKQLVGMSQRYHFLPPGGGMSFAEVLTEHDARTYPPVSEAWRRDALKPLFDALAQIGREAEARSREEDGRMVPPVGQGRTPQQDATVRLVADADWAPGPAVHAPSPSLMAETRGGGGGTG